MAFGRGRLWTALPGWIGLRERINALERDVGYLKDRLAEIEARQTQIAAEGETKRIEALAAPAKAAAETQRIEAEVKEQAARLEATTPHYPRT